MKIFKTKPARGVIKVRGAVRITTRTMKKMVLSKRRQIAAGRCQENGEYSNQQAVDTVQNEIWGTSAYATSVAYQQGKKLAQQRYRKKKQQSSMRGTATTRETQAVADKVQDTSIRKGADGGVFSRADRNQIVDVSSVLKPKGVQIRGQASTEDTIKVRPPIKTTIRKRDMAGSVGDVAVASQIRVKAKEKAQEKMRQQAIQKTVQNTKQTVKRVEQLKEIVVEATRAVVQMAIGLLGGMGAVVALVLVIGGSAAILTTPFGVFWSGENGTETETMPTAVASINNLFTQTIERIQSDNPSDSVEIHRIPDIGDTLEITNWVDVVAVFAVKTAGASTDASDVVLMDDAKVALLTDVFWTMNVVTYEIESIDHPGESETDPGWTETVLHITITSKTYDEMGAIYGFSSSQELALEEMMEEEYRGLLEGLVAVD